MLDSNVWEGWEGSDLCWWDKLAINLGGALEKIYGSKEPSEAVVDYYGRKSEQLLVVVE